MKDAEIQAICDEVRYKDWSLVFTTQHAELNGKQVIYWMWRAPCVNTGMPAWQFGAAFCVYDNATEEGIIRLAYRAAQQAEMHECAENFHYRRARLFDPHLPILR